MAITGEDAVAPDGSPVEVYRRLPPRGEAELISAALPGACSVLDLGCGTGRIADRLVALGHAVVAVDESAEMLEHVRSARAVHATIEGLDLGRTFAAVVLASHLINSGDADQRSAFLSAAVRHIAPGGAVIVQRHDPSDLAEGTSSDVTVGDVRIRHRVLERRGSRVRAVADYNVGDRSWSQPYEAEILDDAAFEAAIAAHGLRFDAWLDPRRTWGRLVRRGDTGSERA